MYINRISANYTGQYYKNYGQTKISTPSFNGQTANYRIGNPAGAKLFEKAVKITEALPPNAKMKAPVSMTVTNKDGKEETYKIFVDKSNNTLSKILIEKVNSDKDISSYEGNNRRFIGEFNKSTGKMMFGEYTDTYEGRRYSFNRGRKTRIVKWYLNNYELESYIPKSYDSNVWVGIENAAIKTDPFEAIFWAMTDLDASILKK